MYSERLNDNFQLLVAGAVAHFYNDDFSIQLEGLHDVTVKYGSGTDVIENLITRPDIDGSLSFTIDGDNRYHGVNLLQDISRVQIMIVCKYEYDIPNFYLHDCYIREVRLSGYKSSDCLDVNIQLKVGYVEQEKEDENDR